MSVNRTDNDDNIFISMSILMIRLHFDISTISEI